LKAVADSIKVGSVEEFQGQVRHHFLLNSAKCRLVTSAA
jgi:hypothetical protein